MDFAYFFLSAIRVKSIQIFFHEFEFKKSILTAIKFKALIEPPVATSSKTSTSLNAYEENYKRINYFIDTVLIVNIFNWSSNPELERDARVRLSRRAIL